MGDETTLTTTITGFQAERVEAMLVEHLAKRFEDATLEEIRKDARGRAQDRIKEVAAELIDATVRDVVANGWEEISTWGERTGERFTLRSYIVKYLKTERYESRDNYGPKFSPVDHAVRTAVAAVFSKEFEAEIDAARQRLRGQIDAALAGKFVETIKGALGLR